ncbi:MAG: hypothetical protein ACRDN0_16580 [Trebonia sp.]
MSIECSCQAVFGKGVVLMMLDYDTLGWDPDLLDGDDLGEPDEPSPEELAGLFDDSCDDSVESENPDLLRYVGIELEQETAGALDADLVVAARQACGNLGLLDDAGVIGIAVRCKEIAARAQGRLYRALQELERRRPPSKRYRRGEDVRERRDAAEGITENVTVQRMPVMASAEAASEIALAFTSTEYAAQKLGEISADLWARMPRLHLELEAGRTTDDRVKVIWEGTRDLSNEDAGKVDTLLSAGSGAMTTGELRDAVRRAVIQIDPDAADKRRQRAEKKARTSLYANANGTATYALEDIPPALGAAAKARVNAIARAAKSAGAREDLPMLEAKSALGLILGTLSLIPPQVPPDDAPEDPGGPGGSPGPSGPSGPDAGPGDWDAVPDPDPAPGYRPASEEFGTGPEPAPDSMSWPAVPGTSSAAAPGCVPIPAGLLKQGRIKLLMPWRSLAGMTAGIGELSWFGPVTPPRPATSPPPPPATPAPDGPLSWRTMTAALLRSPSCAIPARRALRV